MSKEWTPEETDAFMDMVLSGDSEIEIAIKLRRKADEIRGHFKKAFYNRKYFPARLRLWRGNQKITTLEEKLLARYKRKNYPTKVIRMILQRKPEQLAYDLQSENLVNPAREPLPISDVVLAHHYLFHQAKAPIISDKEYEALKQEELETRCNASPVKRIARATCVLDYPAHIRSLAYYMLYKFMKSTGQWDAKKIPYVWTKENEWKNP